jgi:hypothetical protein
MSDAPSLSLRLDIDAETVRVLQRLNAWSVVRQRLAHIAYLLRESDLDGWADEIEAVRELTELGE